jgi:hypothetical protein
LFLRGVRETAARGCCTGVIPVHQGDHARHRPEKSQVTPPFSCDHVDQAGRLPVIVPSAWLKNAQNALARN